MAQQTLYNRYRPTHFRDMIGQEAMLRALRNQVISGRIGHAYLFSGPRGTGKTTLARIFARAMNCQTPVDGEACGHCESCVALSSERAMDIVEIDAASNNGVDHIRELRENVGYLPAQGRYRVYIIDEVHMLSTQAFNALLKTLEEPPAHAVFILATTEVRKLPATVLSRCQRYEFHRYSANQIAGHLKTLLQDLGLSMDDRGLSAIARAADGCMRDALTMLEQCVPLADEAGVIDPAGVYSMLGTTDRRYYFTLADAILSGDAGRALLGVQTMVDGGCDPVTLAQDLQRHFRDLLLVSYGQAGNLGTDDQTAQRLVRQAAQATPEQLLFALGLYTKLEGEMRYASMPRTYLELAIARSCYLQEENLQAVMARVERLEKKFKEWQETGVPAAPAAQLRKTLQDPASIPVEPPAPVPVEPPAPREVYDADPMDAPPPEEEPPWEEDGFSLSEPEPLPQAAAPAPRPEPIPAVFREPEPQAAPEPEADAPKPSLRERLAAMNRGTAPAAQETAQNNQADAPVPSAPAASVADPRKVWRQAREELESRGRGMVAAYMAQGRGKDYSNGILRVSFPPQQASARMALERERNRTTVEETLKALTGSPIRIELIEEALTQEQEDFIRRSLSRLPSDRVELEFDDN